MFLDLDLIYSNIQNIYKVLRKKQFDVMPTMCEWFLDNYYMVVDILKTTKKEMKGSAVKELKKTNFRLYELLYNLFSNSKNIISEEQLIDYFLKFQETNTLYNKEIWLIRIVFQLVLLEEFSKVAVVIDQNLKNVKEHQELSDKVMRIITQMRKNEGLNTRNLFNKLSKVEKILLKDKYYSKMDFNSQNFYKYQIEQIAKKEKKEEIYIAKRLLDKSIEEKKHIGHFLVNRNKGTKKIVYFSSIFIITLLLVLLTIKNIYLTLICLIPYIEIAINLTNYITTKLVKPDLIPKIEIEGDLPYKTSVIISSVLIDKKNIDEIVNKLEVYYYANKSKNLYVGILGDFKDSKTETTKTDEELISYIKEKINSLNSKHNSKPFFALVRKRKFLKSQNVFMGWERKRGAIIEFVRYLKEPDYDGFGYMFGANKEIVGSKYALALDSDTYLSINSVKKLLGAIIHPVNQPVIDKEKNRVVEGYGIIEPNIINSLKSAYTSMFSKIFVGIGGFDPYSHANSDIYQDCCDEATFTGKGIFKVDIFYDLVDKMICDNRVLSHDLLEGAISRCGLASDIELADNFPSKVSSYFARYHRWVRGDWQLIKYLGRTIESRNNKKEKNPISALSKWKIVDNLRRSLVPIFLIGLIFAVPTNFSFIIIMLTMGGTILTSVCDNILYGDYKYFGERTYNRVFYGTKSAILRFLTLLSLLPYNAFVSLDAIIRTLYRVYFSKKKMLEWTTAEEAERKSWENPLAYYEKMWINVVVAICIFIFSKSLPLYFFAAIFIIAPYYSFKISQNIKDEKEETSAENKEFLKDCGYNIYKFFNDFVTEKENFLPPDNVQIEPVKKVAHRTSPTNIGLYLLCLLGFYDMNYISLNELDRKLKNTIETIEKLEKWNGHLYNWYDTKSLELLRPNYVSTVDSGNFVACLIALKEGLKEHDTKFLDLIKRIESLISQTKFTHLYNKDKNLFSIGFNVEQNELTNSYYDLLASESRQTSYIAIARKEVPKEHWYTLSRSVAKFDKYAGLISWTGTMFEYLMPLLLLPNIKGSIFDETYKFVMDVQKDYANTKEIPWGISESGFFSFDINLNYQYKAFGVPDAGLKRDLQKDLVVSPYSSFLALMISPKESIRNLKTLENYNCLKEYGFVEAIDFTPSRLISENNYEIVYSFMAHHQGMSFLSILNVLKDGILRKRFFKDQEIASANELILEKIPTKIIVTKEEREYIFNIPPNVKKQTECIRVAKELESYPPKSHIMTNGELTFYMNSLGNNYIKFNDLYVTRFRNNYYGNDYGSYIYIKNKKTGKIYSPTVSPLKEEKEDGKVVFYPEKGEFRKKADGLKITLENTISYDENLAIMNLEIFNSDGEEKELEIISYNEIILSTLANDIAHPTFNSLFLRTEKIDNGIIISRRPRDEKSQTVYAMHFALCDKENINYLFESSRYNFLGRKHSLSSPQILNNDVEGKMGAVLDPVLSIKGSLVLMPKSSVKLCFLLGVGYEEQELFNFTKKYDNYTKIDNLIKNSITRGSFESKTLAVSGVEQEVYYDILSILIYKTKKDDVIKEGTSVKNLWSLGISGDHPILLGIIHDRSEIIFAKQLITCHYFLKLRGFDFDLVLLTYDENNYSMPVFKLVKELIQNGNFANLVNMPMGVFIRSLNIISKEEENALFLSANLIINSKEKSIASQLKDKFITLPNKIKYKSDIKSKSFYKELDFYNGYGGFNEENEYVIFIKDNKVTPLPWINVIANKQFGFIATESGGGYVFSENSRENKITKWSNDSIIDEIGETIYIKDGDTVETITPYPVADGCDYMVKHGFYNTSYVKNSNGILKKLVLTVAKDLPAKLSLVMLENLTDYDKTISLYYYVSPILDVTEINDDKIYGYYKDNTVIFKNNFSSEYSNRITFISSTEKVLEYETDSYSFFGNKYNEVPQGIIEDGLSSKNGYSLKTIGVIKIEVTLQAHSKKEVGFVLSQVKNDDEYLKIKEQFSTYKNYEKELYTVNENINKIKIKTPDKALNHLMNGWLIYQTLSCRLYARTAFYQAGGAYGFRDQLQDSMPLINIDSKITREQILKHAKHQFKEGDVMHWWHESPNEDGMPKGVRTKFSDDLLWLIYVTYEYIIATGDIKILEEQISFLADDLLNENENEKYIVPKERTSKESLYEHLKRAIDHSCNNFSSRNLPKIGSGDWNDGFSAVGIEGKGESVWLGFFLYDVLDKMAYLCDKKHETTLSNNYLKIRKKLKTAINELAWDGEWFIRAFYDNGNKMGSKESQECKIDAIAQAWSVISGAGEEEKQIEAIQSAYDKLVMKNEKIIKLLDPPFDKLKDNPGYIKSYVPGVRENGGQYTHGAIWLMMAFLLKGDYEKGYELLKMLNPINHSLNKEQADIYKVEPYVVTADIYSEKSNLGRGGWSWYTGSAAWFYKAILEYFLGIKKEGDKLIITPRVPQSFNEFNVELPYLSSLYNITIKRGEKKSESVITLKDDGETHNIEIIF